MPTPSAELSSLTPFPLKGHETRRQIDTLRIELDDAKFRETGDVENRNAF